MKVNYLLGLVLFVLSLNACAVQTVNLTVKVHGNDGKPVDGARVRGYFFQDQVVDKQMKSSHQGITDGDGVVDLRGTEELYVDLKVTKPGYYESNQRVNVRDGSNKSVAVLLREVRDPVAMYARKVKFQPVVMGKEFGYDLLEGDYVSPYGSGKTTDLLLTIDYTERDAWNYEYYLSIRFSNLNDGLLSFKVQSAESEFKSDYLAPTSGYQQKWDFKRISIKGKQDKTNLDPLRNYYFRMRTVVDDQGEIESANYGKIYGEFPEIIYYFNPLVNDRNVEFDLQGDLLTGLKNEEKAKAP